MKPAVERAERVNGGSDRLMISLLEREKRRLEFGKAFRELSERVSVACHQIVVTRKRDDWSLAFAYLAQMSLATLALGESLDDGEVRGAMISNLARLADEGADAIPDRRDVLLDWRGGLEAIAPRREPPTVGAPHPQADSISEAVRLLRNTGPRLTRLTEIYAYSPQGVHRVPG